MASRRKALWDAIKALVAADTSSGGLSESGGANKLLEFLWEPGTTRARNVPSVYVEIQEVRSGSLGVDAGQMLVRMHLYTDVHADSEMDPQDAIAERMATVFHRVKPAITGGRTFDKIWKAREFNAPSERDQMHLIQEYTVLVS